MSAIWISLAILMSLEALWTLRAVYGFREFFFREAAKDPRAERWPKIAVLAPCKGLDQDFEANVRSWLSQDYPDFTVFCVVESDEDAAFSVLSSFPEAQLLVAGRATDCGQKIHNLRFAISQIPETYEAYAFVDSDARVQPDWLRSLAAKLMEHPLDAATGYRWFHPGRSFAGSLRSAWNASVLTLYEESGKRNFAWGGSMAILSKAFLETDVLRFWQGSLSDDYALTNALRASNRVVRFVPRAMAFTNDHITLREFFSWASRQLLITRLYFPRLWKMAFAFHVIWILWLMAGAIMFPLWFLPAFFFVQAIQGWKSNIRLQCAGEILGPDVGRAPMFWLMSPFVGVFNFVMLAANLFSRKVRWRGIEYMVLGPNELRIPPYE